MIISTIILFFSVIATLPLAGIALIMLLLSKTGVGLIYNGGTKDENNIWD